MATTSGSCSDTGGLHAAWPSSVHTLHQMITTRTPVTEAVAVSSNEASRGHRPLISSLLQPTPGSHHQILDWPTGTIATSHMSLIRAMPGSPVEPESVVPLTVQERRHRLQDILDQALRLIEDARVVEDSRSGEEEESPTYSSLPDLAREDRPLRLAPSPLGRPGRGPRRGLVPKE